MVRVGTLGLVAAMVLALTASPASAALVGSWNFDGDLLDSSGMGNHGTAASPTYVADRFGNPNSAIRFAAAADRVTVGTAGRPSNTFSFGGWIQTSLPHQIDAQSNSGTVGTSGQNYAFGASHEGAAAAGAGLSVGINGLSVYEHGAGYMPATAVYNPGNDTTVGSGWNHVMVVYRNRKPTVYLNGVAVHAGVSSARGTVRAPYEIGGGSYGFLTGAMDAVGVWDHALSTDEVRALAGLPANLVANGDFSANAADFAQHPGYFENRSPNNPASAPSWTGGSGINGTATSLASSPFAPAVNAPHFLFIQREGSVEQTITTAAESPHLFTFDTSARGPGRPHAGLTVYADTSANPSLVFDGRQPGSWWLSQDSFQKYAFAFTGAGEQTIRFDSNGVAGTDFTTNITNVAVTAIDQPITVTNGTTFFTEIAGTVGFDFHLAGHTQTFFQRAGAPIYTGNITTDGSAGTFNIHSFGRQAGARNLTFSGNTIALGDKTLSLAGRVSGGNVDSLGQANDQMTTLHDVTLTTNADVHVTRGALRIAGNSVVDISGQLSPPPGPQGDFAWNNLIIQDNAQVTAAGGVDFSNIASNLAFNGGTLTTPSIWGNNHDNTRTIFNGTRIVASQANPDFLRVSTSADKEFHSSPARLGPAGAIFDTNGHDVGILVNLVNQSGQTGTLTKLGAGTLTLSGTNTYTGTTTVREGSLLVNGSLAGTSAVSVGVETVFYDSFDGDDASGLHGTRPVIGSGAWNASTRWTADGSKAVSGDANAYLPFTPAPGYVYSLSLDINATPGTPDDSDWIALGYSAGASVDGNFHPSPNNAVGWILRRANGGFQTFLGPSTADGQGHSGSPGWVNVEVQLDTTGDQWLFEWFTDGTSIRGPQPLANPNIGHVAFGAYRHAVGEVDNFTLAILNPSPALLGGAGTIAGDTTIGRFGTLAPGGVAPGERIGTLTFTDAASLILNPGATIDWDFLNDTDEGITYDHIMGDSLYLPDGEGAINLNIAGLTGLDGYSLSAGDSFTLFSGDVYVGSTLAEYRQDLTHLFNITDNVNWWGTWEVSTGSLILTAVPEPATWLLLLSALACGLLARWRR